MCVLRECACVHITMPGLSKDPIINAALSLLCHLIPYN